MAKKIVKPPSVSNDADSLVEMFSSDTNGLIENLEAIRAFMKMWERDYGDEDDPRMSLITGYLSDIVGVMVCQLIERQEKKK